MTGSRAIAFVGKWETLSDAEIAAQKACENVKWKVFFREDIGTDELILKRVENMKSIMN